MAARVCRHSLLSRLSLIVVVVNCLRAQDGTLREVNILQKVHQVACQHPTNGLAALTLEEAGNTKRTVVTNPRLKSCVGNLTYYGCFNNETLVEVKAILTDLQEDELRTFICIASTDSERGIDTETVGLVNVTNTDRPLDSRSTSDESLDRHGKKFQKHQTSQEDCAGNATAGLTVVIVLTVIFGVISILLLVLYLRVVRAPDVPMKGLAMQYPTPDNLSSDDTLAQATDGGGQGQGLLQYQEPWGQLDDEISDRLAALRPNPRMCLVPGFQRQTDVTEVMTSLERLSSQTSHDNKRDSR